MATPAAAEPSFRVIGRSMATVYLDGGAGEGLQVGDRVQVMDGTTVIAEMAIVAVNEKNAACRVLSLTRPIGKGDRATLVDRDLKGTRAEARAAEGVTTASSRPPALAAAAAPKPIAAASPATPPSEAPAPASPAVESKGVEAESPASPPTGTAAPETAPTRVSGRRFRVKYRSASSAYLEGGRADGLEAGDAPGPGRRRGRGPRGGRDTTRERRRRGYLADHGLRHEHGEGRGLQRRGRRRADPDRVGPSARRRLLRLLPELGRDRGRPRPRRAEGNTVTLSYRRDKVVRIKKKNEERIAASLKSGRVKPLFGSEVTEIREDRVLLRAGDRTLELPNDYIFVFAGGEPPFGFLKQIGVRFGGERASMARVGTRSS